MTVTLLPFKAGLVISAVLTTAVLTGVAVAIVKDGSQRSEVATAMTGGMKRSRPQFFAATAVAGAIRFPALRAPTVKWAAN